MRPFLPQPHEWAPTFKRSINANQYSNFGPAFREACKFLREVDGDPVWYLPVANGTVAIEIAAQVQFKRGSRILIPDFTCAATATALLKAGMQPVLGPVSEKDWHLDLEIAFKNKDAYDGICVVNSFGYKMHWGKYNQFSRELKKPLIYDCAGGWGQEIYTGSPVTYSLHATKNFAIGEGGLIRFWHEEEWERARQYTQFDFNLQRSSKSPHGCNGKLDEIHCAMIVAHLKKPYRLVSKIEKNIATLDGYLKELKDCHQHTLHHGGAPSLLVINVPNATRVERLGEAVGITFKRYYYPSLSEMPGFDDLPRIGKSSPFFETCLAFPRDVLDHEFEAVVDFVNKTR